MVQRKPMRRCIACRRSAEKSSLLRFVLAACESVGGTAAWAIAWDRTRTSQLRGAYLHARLECVMAAARKGPWEHALTRGRGVVSEASVRQVLANVRNDVLRDVAEPAEKTHRSQMKGTRIRL